MKLEAIPWVVLFLPLLAAALITLFTRRDRKLSAGISIAAVVIGGASLMGGRGTIWGTLLGLLLIQTLNNGLDILVVPAYWQKVISGVLIVSAVAVDMWANRRATT